MIADREHPAAIRRQPEPGQTAEARIGRVKRESRFKAQGAQHRLVQGLASQLDGGGLDGLRSGRLGRRRTTPEPDRGR